MGDEKDKRAAGGRATRSDAAKRLVRLTKRERDILERVVAGKTIRAIAAELATSRRKVELHRETIMQKLQVKTLPELVRLALSAGISLALACVVLLSGAG